MVSTSIPPFPSMSLVLLGKTVPTEGYLGRLLLPPMFAESQDRIEGPRMVGP